MKIMFTRPAQRRLQQIEDYHKDKGSRAHIRKLKKDIKKQSKLISENPEMGHEEEYLKDLNQGHRFVLVAKLYKMIYRMVSPIIYITDIFDTRQDPDKMKR